MSESQKSWWSKHVDTVLILGGVVGCFLWMSNQINSLKSDIWLVRVEVANLKTEVAIIKTVLLMKNILPTELAVENNGK